MSLQVSVGECPNCGNPMWAATILLSRTARTALVTKCYVCEFTWPANEKEYRSVSKPASSATPARCRESGVMHRYDADGDRVCGCPLAPSAPKSLPKSKSARKKFMKETADAVANLMD